MEKTTIQLSFPTLERLKFIKSHPNQTYDETINFLIDEVEEEGLSDEEVEGIQNALEEVKSGKLKSIEQIAKEMGIRLS
jgi:macrodomain Ter protein organizer (MatP/YcbG family)